MKSSTLYCVVWEKRDHHRTTCHEDSEASSITTVHVVAKYEVFLIGDDNIIIAARETYDNLEIISLKEPYNGASFKTLTEMTL